LSDDDETSQKWETEWLNATLDTGTDSDEQRSLGEQLGDKAVLLRINAGSVEAGFLGAFCSLDSLPKLLVIKAGSVVENIDASVTEEEFKKRIVALLQPPTQQQLPQSTNSIPQNADSATADVSQVLSNVPFIGENRTALPETGTAPQENAETNVPIPAPTSRGNNATMQRFLTERSARLEAERKKQEEADKEARRATAKARKESADKQAAESSSVPHNKQDWADQQRNRNKEARVERERILKTIESDKAARREKERQRKLAAQGEPSAAGASTQEPVHTNTASGRNSSTCSLQIRLFDGSSLRTKFDPSATLATSVRTYISENSQTDIPYEFRQILLPNPSRNISVGEEGESLRSLGLTPSATLVLVPIKGYTDAYAGGSGGLVSKGFNAGYGLLSGAAGLLGSAVGGVMGYATGTTDRPGPYVAGTADESESSNVQGDRMANRPTGINIRTLRDQREADQNTELYNGNQVSDWQS
jgi:flagellar biosynthesis GTPase FlhF